MSVAHELPNELPPQQETVSRLDRRAYLESILGKHPIAHMLWPTIDYYSKDRVEKVAEGDKIDFLTAAVQDLELAGFSHASIASIIKNHGAAEPTSRERGYVAQLGTLVHDGQFEAALARIEPLIVQKLEEKDE